MEVEQWCVRVALSGGERRRRELKEQGLLDPDLRPRAEGDTLLLPVTADPGDGARARFEAIPVRSELPRHELIGSIAVMQDYDPDAAERLLASRPSLHTVLLSGGPVEGQYRVRRFTVLAGLPTTRTRLTEYGHRFDIDLSLAYFSPRLSTERQRVLGLMADGERVLDMFAGVGPFAITLAARARTVVASDLNPAAVGLLIGNLRLNRCRNVLPLLCDAGRLPSFLLPGFDRIVMNLPLSPASFLDQACSLIRPGGSIHLYALQSRDGEMLPLLEGRCAAEVREHVVHTYSPSQWLAVYDIRIGEPLPPLAPGARKKMQQ
ncbi:MAG: class I SAM-dependent methyltransferase family protein [Methanomicrobiales archaeon]|nr:class I SAM-dependent methyltransferase family protein [Methanomicrobiales archaeon]